MAREGVWNRAPAGVNVVCRMHHPLYFYILALSDPLERHRMLTTSNHRNYEQLGLKFKLFSAEVLFNKGLSLIYMGNV